MLVNSCETKLEGGQLVARPRSSDSRWWRERGHWPAERRILQIQNFRRDYTGIQTPAKPLSPPSGAPHHPEQYPLVFPTEILITQNPPKLRKVSLKVLDSAGAAEQKREITGSGERGKARWRKPFYGFFRNTGYKWTLVRTYKERDFENCDKRQYMSKLLEKN